MTTLTPQASESVSAGVVRWMWAGLALTILAGVAPLVDLVTTESLAGHVRDAYPQWTQSNVDKDTYAITGFLVAIGVLGTASWLGATWLVERGSRAARAVATTMFVLAVAVASYGFAPAGAYDTMLPMAFALIGFVPCVAGLVVVTRLDPAPLTGCGPCFRYRWDLRSARGSAAICHPNVSPSGGRAGGAGRGQRTTARPASSRATGIRNGEQDT